MQIVIVPGPRDEKMVQEIKLNREMLSSEEWKAYIFDCADCEEWLDALYYACGESQEALAEQAEYFHERLIDDERDYYAYRLAKLEIDF